MEGRAPPTPAAQVVARIRAAAAAEEAAAGGAADPQSSVAGQGGTGGGARAGLTGPAGQSLLRSTAWAVDISEISFGRRLGAGAYGEVYEGEWRRSKVAIKKLLHCGDVDEKAVRHFFCEMDILANARHDNIVRFLGGCMQPNNLCILFEYCPQSLYDLLRSSTEPLPVKQIVSIARQVALGIYYLHCNKPPVLHLDLKSANVLLDDFGRAKVCDFGLAHLKLDAGVLTSRMGSPMWTAPEVLKGESIGEAADTYSFAMLLFELVTRKLPYHAVPAPQVIVGVMTNILPRPELPADSLAPQSLASLMRRCWQHEARDRPAFSEVLDALDSIAQEVGLPIT